MTTIRLRPTFSVSIQEDAAETMARIDGAVKQRASELTGQFRGSHAMISIVDSKRHFWSPWLHLDIRELESDRQLVGRFSPHPSIWTAFMFSYLSLAVLSFFSLVIGSSQQMAGQYAWGYVVLPICILVAVILWLVSQAGQKLAQDEMQLMKSIVESSVSDATREFPKE